MNKEIYAQYAQKYRTALLDDVIPFWMRHSRAAEGGFNTCLLSDGTVFDQDKFIWLQARQCWTFAMLYNKLEQRSEWLEMALHGAEFLMRHGQDESGAWYFSLAPNGEPLIQAYNIFSDCFACMAFAQLYQATGLAAHRDLALQTFAQILDRQENPKGKYNKAVSGTRPLMNFALPMILCNLSLELESLLDPIEVEATIERCIKEVMQNFYDEESGLTLENVTLDGQLSDTFDGRLLNPGHAIEAMWFIMDLGQKRQDQALINEAASRALKMLEWGWDEQYGGIFYFMDRKGYPPQQLEWNQKLWWVHLETLVALLKAFELTQKEVFWTWFEKVDRYSWTHFPDEAHGEWFGYLDQKGEILLSLKGGKWKGCFHVPRGLWQSWQVLERLKA